MDNLRKSIQLIFSHVSPDEVLGKAFTGEHEFYTSAFPSKKFLQLGMSLFNKYSLNEIDNIIQKLNEDWFFDVYHPNGGKTIFYLLTHFNKYVLTERELEPYVQYEHLLRWRDLSHLLGEDLFTTSYFAYMDNRSLRHRFFWSWRPVAFTTNNRLRNLLKQGIAENHFHLKGSAPVFDLSWIVLMNSITHNHKKFLDLKDEIKLTNVPHKQSFFNSDSDLEILVYKAAYIRKLLFEKVNDLESEQITEEYLKYNSNDADSFQIVMDLNVIQMDISAFQHIYGYQFPFKGEGVVVDYAIPKNLHIDNLNGCPILAGERRLMYQCFAKIYDLDEDFGQMAELFYAYLLIKMQFRNEFIQVNKAVGFANFLIYQDRKEWFIPKGSIYEAAFYTMAVSDSMKFQNILKFETRIAPKDTKHDLEGMISNTNSIINETNPFLNHTYLERVIGEAVEDDGIQNNFYTIHFIKQVEKIKDADAISNFIIPRHMKLRQLVRNQARAIIEFRESPSFFSSLIKGIDAASSEFAARPEVFAQAFRYVKDHKLSHQFSYLKEDITDKKIYSTYHAGEDFYDIVDGLRTINEAVQFLNFSQGDRIGHALALGIDVEEYYKFKGQKLMMPKEIILDNIVWLLAKVRKFGINVARQEVDKPERLYTSLFMEIYGQNIGEVDFKNIYFPHSIFYDAWKLRGDDPYLYFNNWNGDVENEVHFTYWERCRLNYFYPRNNNIRKNSQVKFLYHEYHFNPLVKKEGKKIKQFDISDGYTKLVKAVQESYQRVIKECNIGIECNPTSNYLISTFRRYSKHPILSFYNLGLQSNHEKIASCPQLFVSINTDDQGIFGTSLENEYALMAIALEKEKDENGDALYNQTMIYNWLDNIRKMGLEQSFG